jgi:hypothetical protein
VVLARVCGAGREREGRYVGRVTTSRTHRRLSHRFLALKPFVTRVNPKQRKAAGSAALIRSTKPGGSTMHLSATSCPTALTPLSVRAARVQFTCNAREQARPRRERRLVPRVHTRAQRPGLRPAEGNSREISTAEIARAYRQVSGASLRHLAGRVCMAASLVRPLKGAGGGGYRTATLLKSPRLSSLMPPASKMACSSTSSMDTTPGLRCMP